MKLTFPLLVLALSCVAGIFSAEVVVVKPTWHTDWRTAQRIARQENRPIFAVMVCKH